MKEIQNDILREVCEKIEIKYSPLKFKHRGITIDKELIKATLEILNEEQDKTLPQNSKSDTMEKTNDGLDKRIKEHLDIDLRTANIISDILADIGVVEVIKVKNLNTNRMIKATRLLDSWSW